jgi:hypothetical protein
MARHSASVIGLEKNPGHINYAGYSFAIKKRFLEEIPKNSRRKPERKMCKVISGKDIQEETQFCRLTNS